MCIFNCMKLSVVNIKVSGWRNYNICLNNLWQRHYDEWKRQSPATPEYFASQGFTVGFKRSTLVREWLLSSDPLALPVHCPRGINITNESREAEIRQIFVESLVLFGGSSMSRLKDTGYCLRKDHTCDHGFPLWRFWAPLWEGIKRTRRNGAETASAEVIVHINMN